MVDVYLRAEATNRLFMTTTSAQLELGMSVPSETLFPEGKHAFFMSTAFKDLCSDPEDPLVRSRVRSSLASLGPVNWTIIEQQSAGHRQGAVRLIMSEVIGELSKPKS